MIQNVDYYNKVKKEPNIKCFHDILTFLLYFLHQEHVNKSTLKNHKIILLHIRKFKNVFLKDKF